MTTLCLSRSNTSTTEDSNTNCSASDISSNGNKKKEAEEKLRGEISKLNLNREKTLADRQLVDSELKQVQGQVKELQTSIRVKENLLDDLIGTDKQVWRLTQFFPVSFCKKSLICLEGKSMTPLRENTILFCSSHQLPRLHLGPLMGFLS